MAGLMNQLQDTLGEMPVGKKIFSLMLLGGTVAGLIVIYLWIQRVDYQVLYSNLSQEDGGTIISTLQEMKVPYKLSANGTSILVPYEKIHELRLQLAGQGLPQGGGVGFEIFDRRSLGVTDFVQKINYRRALQGELSRTVSQLSEVEAARVHLVIPDRSLFQEDSEKSTASVILKLKGGRSLSRGQVQGVVHLIASSVEGLMPQNVTVVDIHGNILSQESGEETGTAMSNSQFEYQKNFEKNMEGNIQSMLERVVGSKKVIVRVASTLNFDREEMTEEKYDPDSAVIRSEQKMQEKSSGTSRNAGGVPGILSNIPPAQISPSGPASSSDTQRKNNTLNFEINKTTSHIIKPTGTLERLSIAVLVDGTYRVSSEGENELREYVPRSPEDLLKYEAIVKTAMGFDEDRGDKVHVSNIPFETASDLQEGLTSEIDAAPSLMPQLIQYGVIGAIFLLVFFFVLRPLVRVITLAENKEIISREGFPKTVAELERGGATENPDEARELVMNKEKALQLAKDHPSETAQMIRGWLQEET